MTHGGEVTVFSLFVARHRPAPYAGDGLFDFDALCTAVFHFIA